MKQFLHSTDIRTVLRAHAALFHRTDQQILRCMFHVDEFQDLCLVPLLFQEIRSEGICKQCRDAFLDDPIFQYRLQGITRNLSVQFMLTTGYRQDDSGSPFDRFVQGIIRRQVTGMQCHHHIRHIRSLIGADVSPLKF